MRNDSCCGVASNNSSGLMYPPEMNLLHNLRYMYNCLLHPQMMLSFEPADTRALVMSSAQKLLDCKQFVKDYEPEKLPCTNLSKIRLLCQLELVDESEDSAAHPPQELIVLPEDATVSDLKIEIANVFQDVYVIFRRLQVDELLGYSGVNDSTQVKHLLGSSASAVRVQGRCISKNGLSKFHMERGIERWTVDCSCGAKDDDGERMLACDICGVWRHTRCCGIHDTDPVPARFVCPKCQNCDSKPKSSSTTGHCEGEIVINIGPNSGCFGNGLPVASDVH